MTRKRIGTGLLEAFSTECPQCHGRGYELHDMPVESHRLPTEERETPVRATGGATPNRALETWRIARHRQTLRRAVTNECLRSVLPVADGAVAAAAILRVRNRMRPSRRSSRWC